MEGVKPYAGSFPLTLTHELKNQGSGTIRVFLTLLALICCAGCNGTPSAPTPAPPPVADPPEVTCPAPVTVSALTSVGAAVTYALPESRKGQGTVSVACTPPSGTRFPVGVTQAECVATDSLSRTGSCTFSVTVAGPPRLRRTRIMAFGDSLTEGQTILSNDPYDLFAPPATAYPTVLGQLLSARYTDQTITVFNRGQPGEQASRALSRFIATFVADAPDVVVLMEGYNDVKQTANDVIGIANAVSRDQRTGRRGPPARRARLHLHAGPGQTWADRDPEVRARLHQRSTAPGRALTEKYAGESGLNCGGVVEILTEPLPAHGQELFRALLTLKDTGHRGALATILTEHPHYPEGQRKFLVCDDGTTVGSLGDAVLEAFVQRRGQEILQGEKFAIETYQTADGAELQVFLEPILPTPTVYVFGGGHVSFFLVRAAKLAGFKAKVIDDRPAFANPERFPEADATIVMDFDDIRGAFDFGQDDYVVLVTRGHQHDQRILEQIYDCQVRYIGMIGSKSKISKMWKRLEAKGIAQVYLDRVRAPIGLNIGADSPEEICISIMAEIIRERRLGKVQYTQQKRSHDRRREAVAMSR